VDDVADLGSTEARFVAWLFERLRGKVWYSQTSIYVLNWSKRVVLIANST
jgi:hypothetical protein